MADTNVSILPARPGTISAEDKATLRDVGVIVVEHENPAELQLLAPFGGNFPTGPVIDAAVHALSLYPANSANGVSTADYMRSTFVAALAKIAKDRRDG